MDIAGGILTVPVFELQARHTPIVPGVVCDQDAAMLQGCGGNEYVRILDPFAASQKIGFDLGKAIHGRPCQGEVDYRIQQSIGIGKVLLGAG